MVKLTAYALKKDGSALILLFLDEQLPDLWVKDPALTFETCLGYLSVLANSHRNVSVLGGAAK